MSGEAWTINSEPSYVAFCQHVRSLYDQHKFITYPAPRIGPDRSLSQNALLHVWLTEYAAHLLGKDRKAVTPGELAGMKRAAKGRFYQFTQLPFMVHDMVEPFTGKTKRDYTSSKSWKQGEMFTFLEWLQMHAANDGLVLEAKGEYAKLQRDQVAT